MGRTRQIPLKALSLGFNYDTRQHLKCITYTSNESINIYLLEH